jgi:predicted nucleotidyltransferase
MNLADAKLFIQDAWKNRSVYDLNWLNSNTLFLTIHGSTSYGLNNVNSDIDMAGICVPPKDYFLGFNKSLEQIQMSKPDGAVYNIIKFCKLAIDNNPNILELLWLDPDYWIYYNSLFSKLLEIKKDFLSSKVKFTYSGYAVSQLKRIKTHRKWLLNPPTHKPSRDEFNLPPTKIISSDQLGALNSLKNENKLEITDENFILYLDQENKYQRAAQEWQQYQNWKITRNADRAKLESEFGYDTKHAMHLVRLMRQGKEILMNHELIVNRSDPQVNDREELLYIRNGGWPYDQLINWAEEQEKELDKLYQITTLPKYPNKEKIDKICIEIVEEIINRKGN